MNYNYNFNEDIEASVAYGRERKLKREEQENRPEQRKLYEVAAAKRDFDGNKRVVFIKALIAAGKLNEWLARDAGRGRYVEMCAELGVEPAGIDEAY